MTDYERGVWYDFGADRHRPARLDVAGFTRDADAVLWRELRLAHMSVTQMRMSAKISEARKVVEHPTRLSPRRCAGCCPCGG